MIKNYELNKRYAHEEYESIVEWWQIHQEYDINEYCEERMYDENGNEILPTDEDGNQRAYNDYVEIALRPKELVTARYREIRADLLRAFDKYKTNVQYGIEQESQEAKEEIMQWYKDLLDLQGVAFENIPERVKYYL